MEGALKEASVSEQLEYRVMDLAEARIELDQAKAAVKSELELLPELVTLQENERRARARAKDLEEQVRDLALANFEECEDRKPMKEVEIKTVKRLEYDAERALQWALTRAQFVCKLDVKAFERVAKAFPYEVRFFAELIEEPKAYIASKLDHLVDKKSE